MIFTLVGDWPNSPSLQERRILEETVAPLTPRSSALPSPSRGELTSTPEPQDTIVRSLADWERKQELLERQSVSGWLIIDSLLHACSSRGESGTESFWLAVELSVPCLWLDGTEGEHRECGMETERKRQDQWHQHRWRQHEDRPKVSELSESGPCVLDISNLWVKVVWGTSGTIWRRWRLHAQVC